MTHDIIIVDIIDEAGNVKSCLMFNKGSDNVGEFEALLQFLDTHSGEHSFSVKHYAEVKA